MYSLLIKRFLDIVVSLFVLVLFLPILIALVLAGWFRMKGNPFFLQDRIGKGGRVFKLIKFRTMTEDRDQRGKLLDDNKRLIPYGRMLRNTSLDELPELINILKGEMSIVGPRPLIPEYLPFYTEKESHRHDVRPGLTGLAQVNGRSFISWEEIFAYDLHYVNGLTFWMDISIILQTICKVLRREDIADASAVEQGDDGQWYVQVKDQRMRLHQPLNIERSINNGK